MYVMVIKPQLKQNTTVLTVKPKINNIHKTAALHSLAFAAIIGTCSLVISNLYDTYGHEQEPTYLSTKYNNRRVIVAKDQIKWMEEENGCFYICPKHDKCFWDVILNDKYVVCKDQHPESYNIVKEMIAN
jgi:hypothetical protein